MTRHWRCLLWLVAAIPFVAPLAAGATTIPGGTISASTTWDTSGSPYTVTGVVYVEGSATPILTIAGGVTVKFNYGAGLIIGNGAAGGLQVTGTSAAPVVLTATTPSAGQWTGVAFMTHATSSSVAYATISYAGNWGNYGGVTITGSSPTIQNTTIQNSSQWGAFISGTSSPSFTSCTISSNSPDGMWISSPATPSLQTVGFTGNTGAAIFQQSKVTFGTVSGLTATSNGTNGILLNGPVDANTTWKKTGIPYVSNGAIDVGGSATPVLTINSGVTVKMMPGYPLTIGTNYPGTLSAVGSASQPIIFTVNAASPSPGSWPGLIFNQYASASSKISFATVSYAGSWGGQGAIHVAGSSPKFDNLNLQNNSVAAMTVTNGTPSIVNSTFASNPAGIINNTASTPFVANLNYWSAAGGPSGAGSGTGESVSSGVVFEPWLIAAPTTSNYIKSSSEKNRTFNPTLTINTTITSATVATGSWTMTIQNGGGTTVRTYTGSGTGSTVVWDGKDGSGAAQPDGTYSYQLSMTGITTAKGLTVIDSTRQLTLTGYGVSNAYFSPNADGVKDTTTISGAFSFDDVAWTLNIKNPGGTIVRTATGNGSGLSYAWDGKNSGGTVQPDNPYTMALTATDGSASVPGTATSTLDVTLPVATVTAPTNNQTLSNVYSNGATNVTVTGTASDLNVSNWLLDYFYNGGWTQITTGNTSITAATLGTWMTLPLTNGQYTLRLQVWDLAGNYKTTSITNTIGNFQVAENVLEFNGSTGGTVTYTSTIPNLTPSLRETLYVRNANLTTVRTLLNNVAVSGPTRTDAWDGKNGSGSIQPDGPYFYIASVTDGTHSMTWDLSSQYLNNLNQYTANSIASFDPFKNQPMVLNRSFSGPGNVTIVFGPQEGISSACPPPQFCWVKSRYEESGSKTYYWPGVDSTGLYRPDATRTEVTLDRASFSANAVVLFGTKPGVSAVTVTPPVVAPALGSATVGFTLATYQNQNASVAITFLNQQSLSVLRTISLTNQAPGAHTATWDGKADNGVLVAPGYYLVTVTATDPIGNQAQGQIMATVQY